MSHGPYDCRQPYPGSNYVSALKPVVGVKWIEEKLTHLRVIHWASEGVYEDESNNDAWAKCCVCNFSSSFHHLFPIAHINHSLGEEDGIKVNH
jgi:hypothetical protein